MIVATNPERLSKALIKHGLVPANCMLCEVVIRPMKATIIRYEIYVTDTETAALSAALAESIEESVTP